MPRLQHRRLALPLHGRNHVRTAVNHHGHHLSRTDHDRVRREVEAPAVHRTWQLLVDTLPSQRGPRVREDEVVAGPRRAYGTAQVRLLDARPRVQVQPEEVPPRWWLHVVRVLHDGVVEDGAGLRRL